MARRARRRDIRPLCGYGKRRDPDRRPCVPIPELSCGGTSARAHTRPPRPYSRTPAGTPVGRTAPPRSATASCPPATASPSGTAGAVSPRPETSSRETKSRRPATMCFDAQRLAFSSRVVLNNFFCPSSASDPLNFATADPGFDADLTFGIHGLMTGFRGRENSGAQANHPPADQPVCGTVEDRGQDRDLPGQCCDGLRRTDPYGDTLRSPEARLDP